MYERVTEQQIVERGFMSEEDAEGFAESLWNMGSDATFMILRVLADNKTTRVDGYMRVWDVCWEMANKNVIEGMNEPFPPVPTDSLPRLVGAT
jgi:hypothetical protein